jgi:hypothetical protein
MDSSASTGAASLRSDDTPPSSVANHGDELSAQGKADTVSICSASIGECHNESRVSFEKSYQAISELMTEFQHLDPVAASCWTQELTWAQQSEIFGQISNDNDDQGIDLDSNELLQMKHRVIAYYKVLHPDAVHNSRSPNKLRARAKKRRARLRET